MKRSRGVNEKNNLKVKGKTIKQTKRRGERENKISGEKKNYSF